MSIVTDKPQYSDDDIIILSHIYLGILSESQCKSISIMTDVSKQTFIPGIMTFGFHFYYTNEAFVPDLRDELKDLDIDDKMMYHKLIIILARYILTNEGVSK